MARDGFFERESHRTVERYGDIAQVFSTYESRHAAVDAKPFQRGINSFQRMFDGHRWWVVTIYWQGAGPDQPIPRGRNPAGFTGICDSLRIGLPGRRLGRGVG